MKKLVLILLLIFFVTKAQYPIRYNKYDITSNNYGITTFSGGVGVEWSKISGGGTLIDTASAMRILCTNGDSCVIEKVSSYDLSQYQAIRVKFYIDNHINYDYNNCILTLSNNNYTSTLRSYTGVPYVQGEYDLVLPIRSFTNTGSPSMSSIDRVKLKIKAGTGLTVNVLLRSITALKAPLTAPVLLNTFDDCNLTEITSAQTLASNGMYASFYAIGAGIGTSGYMTYKQMQDVQALGHDIGTHAWSHVNLGGQDSATQLFNLNELRNALSSHRIYGGDIMTYPFGNYTNLTKKILGEQGYSFARTVRGGNFVGNWPIKDPFEYYTYGIDTNVTLATAKTWIDSMMVSPYRVYTIMWHDISDTLALSANGWKKSRFDSLVAYMKTAQSNGLQILSPSKFLGELIKPSVYTDTVFESGQPIWINGIGMQKTITTSVNGATIVSTTNGDYIKTNRISSTGSVVTTLRNQDTAFSLDTRFYGTYSLPIKGYKNLWVNKAFAKGGAPTVPIFILSNKAIGDSVGTKIERSYESGGYSCILNTFNTVKSKKYKTIPSTDTSSTKIFRDVNCVLRLNLDSTVAIDKSGLRANGTIVGTGYTTGQVGVFGNSWKFTGGTYIGPYAVTQLQSSATMTLEQWIKTDTVLTTGRLFQATASGGSYWYITFGTTTFGVEINTAGTTGFMSLTTPSRYITTGDWHHIVIVYTGAGATNADRAKMYIDGRLMPTTYSGNIPATLSPNVNNVYFSGGTGYDFKGYADEINLYTDAKDSNFVSVRYNNYINPSSVIYDSLAQATTTGILGSNYRTGPSLKLW